MADPFHNMPQGGCLPSLGQQPLKRPDGKWNCGDLDMFIARDGTWFYKGSPIGRKELVCLFASVLNPHSPSKSLISLS